MLSISNNVFVTSSFKGNNPHKPESMNLVREDYISSYDASTAYGKALVKNVQKEEPDIYEKLRLVSDTDTISLEDAVNELRTCNTSSKTKTDLILACAFENDKPVLVINKKAIYLLKEELLYGNGKVTPKYADVIRTCLDENSETFNSERYKNMFNPNGKVKISARLKPRPQNYNAKLRTIKKEKRILIQQAVENSEEKPSLKGNFEPSDFFVPLETQKATLLSDLKNVENIPDDLKNSIEKSVSQNNFNIREVYKGYYSLLNDCKTVDEVKEFYPELKFPKEKPLNDGGSPKSLNNRFANENFDKVVIDTLKKAHIGLKPADDMYIIFENSPSTTYYAMKNAGFEFSLPPKEMLILMDKGDKLQAKYSNIPDYDEKELKQFANKQAVRATNVWGDYAKMTRTSWLPVRLIKNKRLYPDTSNYKTTNMVNAYLYNLYKTDKNADYPSNPLEQYDDKKYLNRQMKSVVNNAYWVRYKKLDEIDTDDGFVNFQSKFDKKAIGKSFEHLESNYTNAFFSKYWSEERTNRLKVGMQNAYDMIYEKVLLNEQIKHKEVTDKDVIDLIEGDFSVEISPKVKETEYSRLKYISSSIKNDDLKARCQSCLDNLDIVDTEYFDSVYNIVNCSMDKNGLNEDKALILINLHDKYLSQSQDTEKAQSEGEYISGQLEPYKTKDGDYDYKKALQETNAEVRYFNSAALLLSKGESEFNTLVEDKFIYEGNEDYNSANKVIDLYNEIPDTFKDEFTAAFKDKTKIKSDALIEDLSNLHKKITSWNYDNDEIIIMDKDKIPQKVVITHNAKHELLDCVGGDLNLFDSYWKKFYYAAQSRTGKRYGQGIKTVVGGSKYDAEIKILGTGGNIRMYSKAVTEADKVKYESDDGINVKYIFDTCDAHL